MTVQTTTHLDFGGEARAALEFYRSVFDGDAVVTTYGELGMPADAPGADRVVFGLVTAGSGFRIMAYDVLGETTRGIIGSGRTRRENNATLTDQAMFVSLSAATLDDLLPLWRALAVDGTVIEPLAASAWSAGFGMLTDRFGVTWSVTVAA